MRLRELLQDRVDRAHGDGRVVAVDPPMTSDEIGALEVRCGALPSDVRELAGYAAGLTVDGIVVRLSGHDFFEFPAMFPCGIPIATDAQGNFWVVDVSLSGTWRTVFFVAHDPPVAMIQARDLASFIEQLFDVPDLRAATEIGVTRIHDNNPYAIPRSVAQSSSDPAIRALAARVDDRFVIIDLRANEEGTGFVWGSAGPNTAVHRAGEELLFAVEQKKRGLLQRLFARK